jgi:hypothetical protein
MRCGVFAVSLAGCWVRGAMEDGRVQDWWNARTPDVFEHVGIAQTGLWNG